MSTVRFLAVLRPVDGGTYVDIPADAVEALRATGRTSVVGTIDGRPFRNQFMPYVFEAGGRKVVMVVNKATRTALGKTAGDTVEFELARDEHSRSVDATVPPELADVLAADPVAAAAWSALAPSRRREHVDHIAAAKGAETSSRRTARVLAGLHQ